MWCNIAPPSAATPSSPSTWQVRSNATPRPRQKVEADADKDSDLTPGARAIATSPLRVDDLVTSPDGSKLAFASNAINQRQEKVRRRRNLRTCSAGVLAAQLPSAASRAATAQLTHNQAVEGRLRWANDNRHIFFTVEVGDVTGPYRDLQPHLYWVDSECRRRRAVEQRFHRPSRALCRCWRKRARLRARSEPKSKSIPSAKPAESLHRVSGWHGTYEEFPRHTHSSRVAFVYTSMSKPAEVYLAESADPRSTRRKPITAFNKLFTERDLPQGKPYQWKADDGTTVEGMLIYPPGKFEA